MARRRTPGVDPAIVDEVLRLRLDGAQLHDLIAHAAEAVDGKPRWDLTPGEIASAADRADALIVARAETNHARAVAMHVARREALYARAVTSGDYSTALAVLRDLGNIQVVYPSAKVAELLELCKDQAARIAELEAYGPPLRGLEAGQAAAPEAETGPAAGGE